MVKYDSIKKEFIIKGDNTIIDLLKVSEDKILLDKETGFIKISGNLSFEDNSTLTLENNSFILETEKIVFKNNSTLILGSDINILNNITTSIKFNNLKNIEYKKSLNINIKNSYVYSNIDWLFQTDGIFSIVNSIIDGFKIFTNTSTIFKKIIFKNNAFIYSANELVFHDIKIDNKFDSDFLILAYNNIFFYNSDLGGYKKLMDTSLLKDNITLYFKNTNLISGYNFDKTDKINIKQEFSYSGIIYDKEGNLLVNKEFEIKDKDKNFITTLVTNDKGEFNIWLPFYEYNGREIFHSPLYIIYDNNSLVLNINKKTDNVILHLGVNVNKDLLLLIERINNNVDNSFVEIKTAIATLLYNSDKPIKSVSPVTVKSGSGSLKLTINKDKVN